MATSHTRRFEMTVEPFDEKEKDTSEDEVQILGASFAKPVAPKSMTGDKANETKGAAAELVTKLVEASGSSEMAAMDEVTGVGMEAQREAAEHLGIMKGRVEGTLKDSDGSKDIATGLSDLRRALDQINPHATETKKAWYRLVPSLPFVPSSMGPIKVLQRISMRYEPVSVHISGIENRLREGRGVLVRDNIELRKMYEQMEAQQALVQEAIYFGETLLYELAERLEGIEDPAKRDRLIATQQDIATRVQDLRTMEEVHLQYFISIEMSRQNNNRLGQAVERTLALATNVVVVGLAIQSAMVRQKSVMEATERTREFLGEVVTSNAASIKQHTAEIGDLYANPVIAIDKIAAAHNDLMDALNTASNLRVESLSKATENIAELARLSSEMQTKVQGLPASDDAASVPAISDGATTVVEQKS